MLNSVEYNNKNGMLLPNSDKMPQPISIGQFAHHSDTYNVYADNFDLSLLPTTDSEVPLSPQSQLSLDLPPITHHIDYIPTTIYQEFPIKSETITTDEYYSSDMLMVSTPHNNNTQSAQYTSFYGAPQLSPSAHQDQFVTIFPPSPAPSTHDSQNPHSAQHIKQEFGTNTLYPPSPPDSQGSLSPRGHFEYFKGEAIETAGSDSESCIDLDLLLNEADLRDTLCADQHHLAGQLDHQLLRGYLQDTSFQRKHNIKPLALESLLMGGWASGDDIGPVILLALEQARKDVQQTCAALNIPTDPQQWTVDQVQAWLQSTVNQFELPAIHDIARLFPEDGVAFARLSDEEFSKRIPQFGSTVYAQLEVWKAACCEQTPHSSCFASAMDTSDASGMHQLMVPSNRAEDGSSLNEYMSDDDDEDDLTDAVARTPTTLPSTDLLSAPSAGTSSAAATTTIVLPPTKTGRQGGAHIHLWQFLKELLATPQQNVTAIRWLDRTKGVFKIEDSVRVARLWGRRKNRPAMNYDKLSRSIRQYYKKGIMKKTERSQRLVYQFCHPYCL